MALSKNKQLRQYQLESLEHNENEEKEMQEDWIKKNWKPGKDTSFSEKAPNYNSILEKRAELKTEQLVEMKKLKTFKDGIEELNKNM
jgi:hypothetical protein